MFPTFQSVSSIMNVAPVITSSELVPGSIVTYTFNSSAISGSTVKNIASGSFDLTLTSPATTTSQSGQEGDGCLVISTSGYATGSFSKTISISSGSGITLSFWFKSINYNQNQPFVKLTVNGGAMWLNCDNLGNGTFAFYIWTGSNYTSNIILASSNIFNGTWKHICVVIQSTSTIKWYIPHPDSLPHLPLQRNPVGCMPSSVCTLQTIYEQVYTDLSDASMFVFYLC
jgi:hypothetical protein